MKRESRKRYDRVEKLAGDAALFSRDCAKFGARLDVAFGDGDDEEEVCRNAYNLRENNRTIAAAEARGLVCSPGAIYSPERPKCMSRAEYEAERSPGPEDPPGGLLDDVRTDEASSLDEAARARAAAMIAKAKADRAYPKRKPGDRW